jgi:hypothetical protein
MIDYHATRMKLKASPWPIRKWARWRGLPDNMTSNYLHGSVKETSKHYLPITMALKFDGFLVEVPDPEPVERDGVAHGACLVP